jgi:DNA repair photolyase
MFMTEVQDFGEDEQRFKHWLEMTNSKELCNDQFYSSPRISSEYQDCSMPACFDSTNFCSSACDYCFSFAFKSNNPAVMKSEFGLQLKVTDFERFKKVLVGHYPEDAKYKWFYKRRKVLQVGSMADPFDIVFENKYRTTEKYIGLWNEYQYPVRFCSKFYPNTRLMELFDENKEKKNYAFMYSIVSDIPEHQKEIEYGAHSTDKRFEALTDLGKMGYMTMIRMRPFIMGTTDISLDSLLEKSKKAKVNSISVEWFCMDSRTNKNMKRMYEHMNRVLGFDLLTYAKKMSPSSRGGYLRLNRDVKEPYIRKIYQWCLENDVHFACSDPDFKELNMSESCCGMPSPEQNKWHKDLSNFERGQWTALLVNARRNFWKKNTVDDVISGNYEQEEISFDAIIGNEDNGWMRENSISSELVQKTSMSAGEMLVLQPMGMFRQTWNNLRSNKNPMNYFDGKVKPLRYDQKDNIVYGYVPHPYELNWISTHHIDLSKN